MFHKEGSFTGKGKKAKDTPLKKSERRKLRDAFFTMLPLNEGHISSIKEQVDCIFLDTKSDVSIRKLKRKDANSNAGASNIFSRSPNSEDNILWPYKKFNQVLLMEIEGMVLPSLALLSILPTDILNLLPTVVVPPIVSKYLCRGADCMRSGIISMPSSHKGWVVIQAVDNPQPFAIGFVTKGTDPSNCGVDAKGVGVRVVTCYGDQIWKSQIDTTAAPCDTGITSVVGGGIFDNGNYGNVGFIEGKRVYGLVAIGDSYPQDKDGEEVKQIEETLEQMQVSETSEGASNLDKSTESPGKDIETVTQDSIDPIDDPEIVLIDAFHDAAVKITKSQLPLSVSVFYGQHLLPAAKKNGKFIKIKETRFKKLGAFLTEQAEKGIIKLKGSGGDPVAFLTVVDRSHIELRDARRRKKEDAENNDVDDDKSSKKKLVLANLYIIPRNTATLMHLDDDDVKGVNAKSEERRGSGYLTASECRDILNKYITMNGLVDEYDPEMVELDGPLCDSLFRKTKKELKDGRNEYEEAVTRKVLNERWLEKMDKAYAIVSLPGSVIISMKRGAPPKVSFVVESRQNRKKFMTRVRGLEEYAINPVEFANDVSKRFACSSTIVEDAGCREALKKGHVECEFQGNLVDELKALLTGNEKLSSHGGSKNSQYSIPKGVIEVTLKKGVPKKKR